MEISKAVQGYLEASRIREQKSGSSRFYLSDMGKCMRMRWLKRKGIKAEFAPHVNWIFKIGDLYHDFVYKALESQGRLLESEDYVKTEHFIGRYDGIVKDEEGKAVLDIKSAPSYKVKRILAGEDDEQSIAQILSYQMLLMDEGQKDLKKSILLYVNKDPSDRQPEVFVEKHYRLTNWRKGKLKEEMNALVDFWEKDKIPPCTCPAWMKNYNSFQPLCGMDEAKLKKIVMDLEKGKQFITTKEAFYLVKGKKKKELSVLFTGDNKWHKIKRKKEGD